MDEHERLEELARVTVNCGFQIHKELGPGLLESVYELLLYDSLVQPGFSVERQKPIDIRFNGHVFDAAVRADLLVEGRLLIELKSVDQLLALHAKQVITCLRLMNLPLGLLVSFGGATFKEGIKRIANNHGRR